MSRPPQRLSRREAIEKVRQLAQAGKVDVSRNAQRDMENLGYDIDDVCECLASLEPEDCTDEQDSRWQSGKTVYVFEDLQFEADPLYVKIAIDPTDPNSVFVLSFKYSGSVR